MPFEAVDLNVTINILSDKASSVNNKKMLSMFQVVFIMRPSNYEFYLFISV